MTEEDERKEEPENKEGEKTEEAESKEEKETRDDKETEDNKEKKQLMNALIIVGFLVLFFVGIFVLMNSSRHFTYKGVEFDIVKEGNLRLYRTAIPVDSNRVVTTGKAVANYNFYFRNDPRSLKNIQFDVDDIIMRKNIYLNFTDDFNCNGYGIIGTANMVNLMTALGGKPMKNETAKCEAPYEYTFIQLQEGDKTGIEQTGHSCYNLNINNCEVLKVTEKLMIEMLSRVNEAI